MMADKVLQPLQDRIKIVNDDGTPTQYFIRWAQQKQIDIRNSVTAEQVQQILVDFVATLTIAGGTGIQVTGSLALPPVTITLNAGINMLTDVDTLTTPPTNGQALVWDTATSLWKPGSVASGGGGSGALTFISQQTLGAAAASVTFSSIPQTYEDLIVVISGRGDTAATEAIVYANINGDSGANYYTQRLYSHTGTSPFNSVADTKLMLCNIPAATAPANRAGQVEIFFDNYAKTTFNKTAVSTGHQAIANTAGNIVGMLCSGQWANTNAITQLAFTLSAGNFVAGTTITLYARVKNGNSGNDPTLYLIHDQILAANAATYDVTNIPQTYEDLVIMVEARQGTGGAQNYSVRPNNDSGANYTTYFEDRTGTNTAATTSAPFGQSEAATATASVFAHSEGVIYGYSKTNRFKNIMSRGGCLSISLEDRYHAVWKSNAAITSLRFFPGANSFLAGTRIRVYGRKPSVTPATAANEKYFNQDNTVVSSGTTPVPKTPVISVTIPASGAARTFMVNGNIVWTTGVHGMRGSVILDGTAVWGITDDVDPVMTGDGADHLVFSGVLVTVPGDGVAHTISLAWSSQAATTALTFNHRQIVAIQVA